MADYEGGLHGPEGPQLPIGCHHVPTRFGALTIPTPCTSTVTSAAIVTSRINAITPSLPSAFATTAFATTTLGTSIDAAISSAAVAAVPVATAVAACATSTTFATTFASKATTAACAASHFTA